MSSVSFNDHWSFRPKTSIFSELQGSTSNSAEITLPHDAQFTAQRSPDASGGAATGYFPSGAFEYLKSFDVPEHFLDKRVTLELQAVHRDAMVYVNGHFAAQRPFGYSTFFVELDPYLKYGEQNTIRVDARSHDDSRWYTGTGIHRDTRLHVTELIHTTPAGIQITTPDVDNDRAAVHVAATVRNEGTSTQTVQVAVAISDPVGALVACDKAPVTLKAGASAVVRLRAYVDNPKRWNVETPDLYSALTTVEAEGLLLESRDTPFGIRTLTVDPARGLYINGAEVKLRGACIHHDNGLLGAAAIARAEERRIEILKRAGFNAIRSSHNPISQAMLDACDRLGMLVMDETFDMWAETKTAFDYSLNFPEWWERDVEAMVAKDINHPSVIFYSIGNEIPETGTGLGAGWGRKIAEKIRSLDSTRLITNGINGFVATLQDVLQLMKQHGQDGAGQGVNDLMGNAGDFMNQISASPLVSEKTAESFSVLDVAGINYGDGRYELDRDLFPNRVIVGTETFPTKIADNWGLVKDNAHVIGDFTWTGWDYLGEAGIGRVVYNDNPDSPTFGATFPWLAAWCGDIDITGHRRPASFYRETVFGLRDEPYIAVQRPENHGRPTLPGQWAWSDTVSSWSWASAAGTTTSVEVYSNADEVELTLNGRSVDRQKVGATRAFQADFTVDYEPGELTAISYKGGRETGRSTLRTATKDIHLEVTPDRTSITANDSDLCFVEIALQDKAGSLANHADRTVSVVVSGPAVLRALGSARPDPAESFNQASHHTFDGRALAIIRPTGEGIATVIVRSDGLADVTFELRMAATPAA